ncbi:uncharacterized protein LOC133830460 [Humulus lupulus]|uniref:uncharacterized protein LOC133830460 n=1 Tax=Humulus lupulus TaxID=3486 RepID=UPI002B417845|nr:uncharacterized protein LOC133830460 [Humulus lupulus]XP_062116421.1 uncharacterized protein LOC133830460 [Humulus lupulus]
MAPVRSIGLVDPGWEHGIAQDEKKKKVKCNYCGKIVSGGIYRLKQHLARVSGEVTYCNKAPEEVYLRMKENLEGCRSNKKPRLTRDNGQTYLNFHSNDDEELGVQVEYRSKGKQLMINRNLASNCTPLRSLGYVDPGWEHCVAQDERKKKVKCNYCEKIVSGGINRFKQHLARIPGEVAPCKHAPDEVYVKMKDNMKWHRTGRKQRRADVKEISSFYAESDSDDEEDESEEVDLHQRSKEKMIDSDGKVGKDRRKSIKDMSLTSSSEPLLKRSRLDSVFMNTFMDQTPECYRQVKVKTVSNKKPRKEVISAICRFFYHAGVPLQASDSVYFYKMLELVGQHGQGLVGPPSQLTSGRFLQEEVANLKNYLIEYRASWAITGCSILADSWRDSQGRTLINFLSSGPNGVYFVSSIDATEVMEDSFSLFKLLDKVVEEIGEENVVQVITRNTPAYKTAGKMLEEKRNNLFWTPCATDCIDQMLEDFLKIRCVGECMEKGQQITKFIYSQIWLINLMKNEFTQGKELLRPAGTRCASSFVTLQSLLDHRIGLKRMFQSSKWVSSGYSKASDGKEVEKIVLNTTFWKKVHFVVKSVDPIMQVLQKVESGDNFSMPSIYYEMYRAKLAIKSFHGDDGSKYGPFLDVVENHGNSLFYHRLYMAAYFLNPAYRYQPDFVAHTEVVRGLNDCITRLEPDNAKRVAASMQLSDYNSAKADFGTELAISTRTDLDPAAWWQQHGISCVELQRIAVRILSQTCSSFGCEHNWSVFDQIYRQRHNRLAQERLNDLIYVHYNLRLRERHQRKRSSSSTSLDIVLLEHLLDDWIGEEDKKLVLKDEEILCNEMELANVYEDETIDYEDGTVEKGCVELVTLSGVNPSNVDAVSDDDDENEDEDDDGEVNYFDDDLSE